MSATTPNKVLWTVDDLDHLPENGDRYEVIDGDLYVTRVPHWKHQAAVGGFYFELQSWSKKNGFGKAVPSPGVNFSLWSAVIPDVVWCSTNRLERLLNENGHLTGAPELIVEVLSQSQKDKDRDRKAKLKLYSVEGVQEYWICDYERQIIQIFRRDNAILVKAMTLYSSDTLTSPLLRDFSCRVEDLFD
mgnify:CR=1 FL=1